MRPGSGSRSRRAGFAFQAPYLRAASRSGTRIAPTPLAAGCAAVAARDAVRWLGRMALDSHNRKNDHAGRLGIGVDVTAAAERAMPFRKLHDDSHAPPPPAVGRTICPDRRF